MIPPALFGGHSTATPGTSLVFIGIVLAFVVLRSRARGGGRGPAGRGRWGGGPGGPGGGQWGNHPSDQPPVQWDIRKPGGETTEPPGTTPGGAVGNAPGRASGDAPRDVPRDVPHDAPRDVPRDGPSDVQNPPSDL